MCFYMIMSSLFSISNQIKRMLFVEEMIPDIFVFCIYMLKFEPSFRGPTFCNDILSEHTLTVFNLSKSFQNQTQS